MSCRWTNHRLWPTLAGSLVTLLACSPDRATAPPDAGGPDAASASAALRTRTYYVAADLVDWDFAPSGINQISGLPFGEEEEIFVTPDEDRIGSVYTKALYREYTDVSFTTRKSVEPEWEHLGALGPALRAQVGDTIKVVFKNNTPQPFTMHAHGVFYLKDSEGAPYDDGTSGAAKDDDAVPQGAVHTYVWPVPARAGPARRDASSIVWMYHSHINEPRDVDTGLMGPIIITAKGKAREDGRPKDVDREFVNLFMIFNENNSWFLPQNIARTGVDPSVDPEEFEESNLKHGINGYVYGNLPLMTMHMGERVRWYILGMGNEMDLHTPHWHGQSLTFMGMRTDVIELLPGSMRVLDMRPDNPGIWLYHCHVNDHITAGMLARFQVLP
jgi:FtsP/CotA-like multicopper oxidase with cupredoxin domain